MKFFLLGIVASCFFNACSPSGEQKMDTGQESQGLAEERSILVEEAWARPAGEGRVSAAYFTITNHSSSADTLLSVSSDIANLVEIHESFEQEGGMMGMREAGELRISPGQTVKLEPGGLHIMLIQLNRQLVVEDTLDLTLHFSGRGDLTIMVDVKQQL